MKTTYWLLPVWGCVEPEAPVGPFSSFEEMEPAAKELHRRQKDEDALFWMKIENGLPTVDSFSGSLFDGEVKVGPEEDDEEGEEEEEEEPEEEDEEDGEKEEYKRMVDDGCVRCGSPDTREANVSINGVDGIPAAVCNSCGYAVPVPKGVPDAQEA